MVGGEVGGGNEPPPLLDEDWRQLRVMRSHLAHSAAFREARRWCTREDMQQNAQDHADEMEVLGSIYGEDMIRIPDLSRGIHHSAQASSGTRGESSGHSSGGHAADEPSSSKQGSLQEDSGGLSAFLVLVHVTLDGPVTIQACAGSSPCGSSSASNPGSSSTEDSSQASSSSESNGGTTSNGSDTADGAKPTAHGDRAVTARGDLPRSKSQMSITASHLPPLRLLIVLPSTYPSSSPPLFSLICHWLPPPLLSALASHLQSLWAEQQGTPVVYTWAAWLASEGLQHLGMERTITLSPLEPVAFLIPGTEGGSKVMSSGGKGKGPALLEVQEAGRANAGEWSAAEGAGCSEPGSEAGTRVCEREGAWACSCSVVCSLLHSQPDMSLSLLAQYSRQREAQLFNAGIHECGICLRELPGADFLVSPLCSHFFCQPCSKHFANALVADGNLGGLKCPDTSCRAAMPYEFLRSLLEPEVFQRWEALTLQRALDSMRDVVYCPRCQDALVEASEHFAHCGRCSFSFCSLCLSGWHGTIACVSPEMRLKLLMTRKEASAELLRKERDLEQQVQSLKLVEASSAACPVCNMAIQKSEGCNKMTCSNCYCYFCYRCKRAISGYDHFRDGNCVLFNEEEIQAWERRMAQEQLGPQGEGDWQEGGHDVGVAEGRDPHDQVGHRPKGPEGPDGPARRCPRCRQVNAKVQNNNDMHCFACRTRFCGHCGAKDFKGLDHFGKNRCTQHTPS